MQRRAGWREECLFSLLLDGGRLVLDGLSLGSCLGVEAANCLGLSSHLGVEAVDGDFVSSSRTDLDEKVFVGLFCELITKRNDLSGEQDWLMDLLSGNERVMPRDLPVCAQMADICSGGVSFVNDESGPEDQHRGIVLFGVKLLSRIPLQEQPCANVSSVGDHLVEHDIRATHQTTAIVHEGEVGEHWTRVGIQPD